MRGIESGSGVLMGEGMGRDSIGGGRVGGGWRG